MTVATNPPALAGAKPIAAGLTGAALGFSAFGASAAIVTHTPDGGSLTANDLTSPNTEAIEFDLTDLGAITSSVVTLDFFGTNSKAGHLYLIAEFGNVDNDLSGPGAAYNDDDGASPGGIAKSGVLKAAVFEENDLIDASSFKGGEAEFLGEINDTPTGVNRYIGFAIGPTLQTASIGWVQFTLGSISSTGLAINTTAGQGLCAGTTNAAGVGNCPSGDVPVPPSLALLATGMAGLAAVRRRRKLDA